MKFGFCGYQSVPEWFLSQLNLLSSLSFIKLRKIAGLYVNVMLQITNNEELLAQILEILQSSDFSENESKTIVAMIDFILSNSAKNDLDQEQLMKELIDLGIPKENCQSLWKIYEQNLQKIRNSFRDRIFRMNKYDDVVIKRWLVLASSESKKQPEYYSLSFSLSENNLNPLEKKVSFCCTKPSFEKFVSDMGTIMKLLSQQTN